MDGGHRAALHGKVHGLAYHNKKDVLLTFSSVLLKPGKFQNGKQRKAAVGVYPLCIYTWHRGAPSSRRGTLCVILYIPVRRRHLLLLILVSKGFSRTSIAKDMQSNQIPAPFLFDGSVSLNGSCVILRCGKAEIDSNNLLNIRWFLLSGIGGVIRMANAS